MSLPCLNYKQVYRIEMLRYRILFLRVCLQQQFHCNFSKMLKLTPLAKTNNTEQQLLRSIVRAKNSMGQFYKFTSTQSSASVGSVWQEQQKFMELVGNINVKAVEQKMEDGPTANQVLRKMKNEGVFANAIDILIAQKSFTQKQKQYVTNLFLIISNLMRRNILQSKKGQIDQVFFKQFMQAFNQYFVLLQMKPKLILNYMFLTNNLIATKAMDSNRGYFVNQKIIIDEILDNKDRFPMTRKDTHSLISYLSLANVIANYPQRYYEFVQYLINKLDNQWQKQPFFRTKLKRFIPSLYFLNYNCKKLMRGFITLMHSQPNSENIQIIVSALNAYLNLKSELYVGKPIPGQIQKSLKNIVKFIKSHKDIRNNTQRKVDFEQMVYRNLIPTFFRSSIWEEQIWLLFADWLDTEKNYQKMQTIHLYTLFDLINIDKDIISPKIIQRLQSSKKKLLLVNNLKIEDVDLIKVYNKQFGDTAKPHYTIQQQIANNLRSVSKTSIKTQVLVHFFIVDILMNDNVVVEINNNLHYIQNQNKQSKTLNIKSAFRKRILQKLGYKFLQFQVDLFVQGNYEFLKVMQKESAAFNNS